MFDDFFIRALLAGVGLALASGPLGSFVIWRRMAYFGDATSHAAILGVALALAFDLPVSIGTLGIALMMGLLVAGLAARGWAMDTTLGVLAHGALALGLMAVSLVPGARINLSAYLFGDILAVGTSDLIFIWVGGLCVIALLYWRWPALLTGTLNDDLAAASGLNPHRERLVLTLTLAVTVAMALKIVGALLIAAMLIIPAAGARNLARSPEAMAIYAAAIGVGAVIAGLFLSLYQDTPAGPSIITAAMAGFIITTLLKSLYVKK